MSPFLSGTANDGGLTMTGPGTLTLSSGNTYNGGTIINSGTLVADFSLIGTGTNATLPSVLPSGGPVTLGAGAGLTIYGNPNAAATTGTWSTTAGWATLIFSSGGNATGLTVGEPVSGPGIPAGAYITNIVANTQFFISGTANSTATSGMTFGGATYNAVNQSIGALNLGAGTETIAVYNKGDGTNTSAGTGTMLTVTGTISGPSAVLNKIGSGTFNIDPGVTGSNTVSSFLIGSGSVIQNSGTMNVTGTVFNSFTLNGGASYTLNAGAYLLTHAHDSIGTDGNNGASTFMVNGGTWMNTAGDIAPEYGSGGNGSALTINSGLVSSVGGLTLGVNTGTAIFNLNGGTAAFGTSITAGGQGSTGVMNLNGGTLQALSNLPIAPNFAYDSLTANVMAGGAIFNTNGFTITSYVPLLNGTTSDGGVNVSGPGTLTLSSTNTYNGGTIINSGTLAANYSLIGTGTTTTLPSVLPSGRPVTIGTGGELAIYGNPNAVGSSSAWTTGSGSRYITWSSGGNTTGLTVGEPVTGPGIPAGAYITNVGDSTHFYINTSATSAATSTLNFTAQTDNVVNQSIGALP